VDGVGRSAFIPVIPVAALLLHTLLVPTVAMTQLQVSQGLFIKVQIIISMYPLPGTVSKEGVGWPLVLPIAAAPALL
jgi:hypothetical protein